MAQSESHAPAVQSTNLPTLSRKARTAADILQRLVDDLRIHNFDDPDGAARICAVSDVLLNGTDAELSRKELDHLLRLDVPRALVAGDTRDR